MDPDLIRLVLIVLGVLLVAGIYFWDSFKKRTPRAPMVRSRDDDDIGELPPMDAEPEIPTRREPRFSDTPDASVPRVRADVPPPAATEPAEIGSWDSGVGDQEPQLAMDLEFAASDDAAPAHAEPPAQGEIERKLVVLHLVPTGANFRGDVVDKACQSLNLRLGDMSIYHYHDGASAKVLFSIANMVEPGSFPVQNIDAFSTPGLTLFTQLPGARDGADILEVMLRTGRQLGSLLKGELQDERHNKLTPQMEAHIVEAVVEHRRRLRLARSRR